MIRGEVGRVLGNIDRDRAGREGGRLFMKRIPAELRGQFEARRTETNIGRMYVFAIYTVVLQIALNILNVIKQGGNQDFGAVTGGRQIDIMYYVILSLFTLFIGLVFWVLISLARKNRISNPGAKKFLVNALLYIYCAIQLVFCTFNILSSGGVNSYIITVLIIGMIPVIRPLQSLISICFAFFYVCAAMYLSRDVSQVWNSVMLTDTWTNLIVITGLSACGSVFFYDMYVSNFMQSVQLERKNKELSVLANTDQMTGVPNRRAFVRSFEGLWQSAVKSGGQLVVAIADIDFFKAYNDTFGHLEGDKCLMSVANCLQESFRRSSDIVSRYGGEEFLLVFEAMNDEDLRLADKARENVHEMRIPHARTDISPYVSISIGVCVVRPTVNTPMNGVLKAADDALYESKRGGRNRTTVWEYPPPLAVHEATVS
jgi:diguanylate cyclase (GGDEF)-like protein